MINIFKVVEGEGDINKKDYKNKHFFSKIVKTVLFWKISLLTLPKTWISSDRLKNKIKRTSLNENVNGVGITKLKVFSHAINFLMNRKNLM